MFLIITFPKINKSIIFFKQKSLALPNHRQRRSYWLRGSTLLRRTFKSLSLFDCNVVIGYKLLKKIFFACAVQECTSFFFFLLRVSTHCIHHIYSDPFSLSAFQKTTLSINTFFLFFFFYQTYSFCCNAKTFSSKAKAFFCSGFYINLVFFQFQNISYIFFHGINIAC